MRADVVKRVFVVCFILMLPAVGYAQEATITGTITDSTGAVLPGVTVVAVHEATGNRFEAVTDGLGTYRIPVRVGAYRIMAELPGFATVTRTGVQLLVGQTASLNMQMAPSTLQETVTVTAEAPLLDVTSSEVSGNIDPQQMQELPVQGRGWTTLALLAPGNRTTAVGDAPVQDSREDNQEYQVNMDGQQITNNLGTGGQPRYSRDVIAEFQFISNRFDATQGRSPGVQVNAVTKSGTNQFAGLFSGYYRSDTLNAEDHVLKRKRPVDIQQYSTTFGGPIVRDRFHFFGNFEYEREPLTSIWNTPFPAFNITLSGKRTVKVGGLRLDYQVSPQMRLMAKTNRSKAFAPFGGGANTHPAGTGTNDETTGSELVQFTRVLGSRALNEIKAGHADYRHGNQNLTKWTKHWQAPRVTTGSPRITFRGFSVPGNNNYPRYRGQDTYSVRDDFTLSYNARGRHDMRAGGEYLFDNGVTNNCSRCMGNIDARGGNIPANIEALFPDPFNADTWNLAALSPITRRYTVGTADSWVIPTDLNKSAFWVQDDWRISDRLTLNLGLRYDVILNAFAQDVDFRPWETPGRPQDTDNIQPRVGFAWRLNDDTVVRGGGGKYYADIILAGILWPTQPTLVSIIAVDNDGRADFAANPFPGGRLPTLTEANQRFCYVNNGAPGCLFRDAPELAPPAEFAHVTEKWQTSIGLQRQLRSDMVIEADYVYAHGEHEKVIQDNINITFNPSTGVNLPFSNTRTRFEPFWGVIGMYPMMGWSNYHALQMAFTKRLSDNWQASATYTTGGFWTGEPLPQSGLRQVTFPVAKDLGGDYSLAPTDQRHRVVFNGIWQVGYGFQVSGLYFFGSGERDETTSGAGDLRDLAAGLERLRADGTLVPRAGFVGEPIHRVDIRLQQRVPIAGRVRVDGILEMFNLFNRANYGAFETNESSPQYRQPLQSANIAYAPFTMQLGFRVTF
jgi:hypothetical protein